MTRGTPIPETVTLHVPFRVVKRGGRKEMQLPEGATQPRRTDSTLVKALARAFRWKRMLESGEFATIAELAEREGIAPSYMTRVLRLTLLAPNLVDAILDGQQGTEVTLARALEPFSVKWSSRRSNLTRLTKKPFALNAAIDCIEPKAAGLKSSHSLLQRTDRLDRSESRAAVPQRKRPFVVRGGEAQGADDRVAHVADCIAAAGYDSD